MVRRSRALPSRSKGTGNKERKGHKRNKKQHSSLDPITLIDGDLDEIGDKVCDTMAELFWQFEQ